jgi:hypothetical protein
MSQQVQILRERAAESRYTALPILFVLFFKAGTNYMPFCNHDLVPIELSTV